MFTISDLSIGFLKSPLLTAQHFSLGKGQLVRISGENGSGKSLFFRSILGDAEVEIFSGKMSLDEVDNFLKLPPEERYQLGVFVSFQELPVIPGVSVIQYLKAITEDFLSTSQLLSQVKLLQKLLKLPADFYKREMNLEMSVGQKRKLELLQIELLPAKYIFLDEIDSGLDKLSVKIAEDLIAKWIKSGRAVCIISHSSEFCSGLNFTANYLVTEKKLNLATNA